MLTLLYYSHHHHLYLCSIFLLHDIHLVLLGLFMTLKQWMSSALSIVPSFGWTSASLTPLKQILGLVCAVIKAKSNLPIIILFLLSFIGFSLIIMKVAFTITFVTIIKL